MQMAKKWDRFIEVYFLPDFTVNAEAITANPNPKLRCSRDFSLESNKTLTQRKQEREMKAVRIIDR